MNGIIKDIEELIEYLANVKPGMKSLFICKGKEIYLYEHDADKEYERLELFANPEIQEGYWHGKPIWAHALAMELEDVLPIGPMQGTSIDSAMLAMMVPDLLAGNLTQKQIRDALGITDESNANIAEQKDTNFDDFLRLLQEDDD